MSIDLDNIDFDTGGDYGSFDGGSYEPMADTSAWDVDPGISALFGGGDSAPSADLSPLEATDVGSSQVTPVTGTTTAGGAEAAAPKSLWEQATKQFTTKDGGLDLDKMIKMGVGLAGGLSGFLKNKEAGDTRTRKSAAELQGQLVQNKNQTWTPQQAQWANQFFNQQIAPTRGTVQAGAGGIKSIMPSQGYAEGGGIGAPGDTRYGNGRPAAPPLERTENIFQRYLRQGDEAVDGAPNVETLQYGNTPRSTVDPVPITDLLRSLPLLLKALGGKADMPRTGYAEGGDVPMPDEGGGDNLSGGAFGLIEGQGDGQSDDVPINAARGEYILDAETVSMIGNGSNEAGAEILDQWRQKLREHKRDAPSDDIAPPSRSPEEYMPGGAE